MTPLQKLAKDALDVQDACNLSGVALGFGRAMVALREAQPEKDTNFYNTHPVAVLWSSKIASLTGSESMTNFSRAYEACKALVGS